MKKWEYHEAVIKESEDVVTVFDQLGDRHSRELDDWRNRPTV